MATMRSVLIVMLVTSCNLVFAASFDCNNARTRVEKQICSNKEVSKLDSDLAIAYEYVLSNASSKSNRSALIADQKKWITDVRDKCNDANCLTRGYIERINSLILIRTKNTNAHYVADQNERRAQIEEFNRHLNLTGLGERVSTCQLVIRLSNQIYGAICNLKDRTVMVCSENMGGQLAIKFYGFVVSSNDLADFTAANCH
ncbi:MAG: lysozyme inhibitor LprI family protein [Pseudomonadota bacterium]